MSESRWAKYTKRAGSDALSFSSFLNEAEGVNPTGTGIETPGEKAARLGLVSDGHGSYTDPHTGEVKARTVNGELVFYDDGPTGGAVSDGEGGGEGQVTSAPTFATFRDQHTGEVVVPPAKPETPEELNAVPDPVPSSSPAGYEDHMEKKREVAKRKAERSARLAKALQLDQGEEDPMDSIEGRRDAVDASVEAGRDPAIAHELVHDHDPTDPESNASLAASLARIMKTSGPAKIKTYGQSLLSQDQKEG